ncbi:hypothetical protein D3C86_2145610 [compost metagenome]
MDDKRNPYAATHLIIILLKNVLYLVHLSFGTVIKPILKIPAARTSAIASATKP